LDKRMALVKVVMHPCVSWNCAWFCAVCNIVEISSSGQLHPVN
jgi:hypothetical protein